MNISDQLTKTDIFKRAAGGHWQTGEFVGRPFSMSYSRAELLTCDSWKDRCKGIPQGCFLLAYYDNEADTQPNHEAVLLRVIKPTKLPTDQEVISSMVEYYKDNIRTGDNTRTQLDQFTRYEFSFSGLECSVLGSFYKDGDGKVRFGADLESFYSAHNYSVVKPSPEVLKVIVNYREHGNPGGVGDIRVGRVRYSSSRRFQQGATEVPVFVQAPDFAGKRTALFGMTRTGKSNTLKKIIQACVDMNKGATMKLDKTQEDAAETLNPWTEQNGPKYPIGQIVFDVNGEYANPNLQDQGTAIFDFYKEQTIRYSTIRKEGFREMKVNFYTEIETGFELIKSFPFIADNSTVYMSAFKAVDLSPPADCATNRSGSAATRYDRRVAVYRCILHRAGFPAPASIQSVSFAASDAVKQAVGLNQPAVKNAPLNLSLDDAVTWWEALWTICENHEVFSKYKKERGHEWADEDLKSLLVMLTRKRASTGGADCAGFRMLNPVRDQHTNTSKHPFDMEILTQLRNGKIVIVDLSLGDPKIQAMFSERICRRVFHDALSRFTETRPNNFIQLYFEEAHTLFPKQEDKDLLKIYNRLAKEGAKLNLGLIYATQEVSSISSNILKATQNWFISHLNNEDEIKELRKYYDFSDFTESLIRFSQDTDKGFVRMKTYSNPFHSGAD